MDEVAFGRYRLLELIGEGGMGQVFKAHDGVIGRDVAIKVLPPEMSTLAGYRERFRREAQVAARLTEPHIIPIHDTGEIDGRLYLVMPVIEGIDVQTVLHREGPMTPPRAVRVIQQLAAALNTAHRHGLVHRDIKPSNALMTADEHVYLIDFGIAHDASATRMTQTGTMVGTFSYMAPERFLTGTVDARADVYSLACVLHECLTGARPFPGDSMEQQIAGHLTMDPPKPSSFSPAIPAGFDEVIARGMAKQPAERYQTATELSAAAQNALTRAPAPPPPPPPGPTFVDERRPQPPAGPRPPMPPRPTGPTMPAYPAAQQPTTQQWMPLAGSAPQAPAEPPAISVGRFACVLFGVVLASLATAVLLVPWEHSSWTLSYYPFASALMWLVILGVIPGIVLLAVGRGRTRADRTMTGCALVTLGLSTLFCRLTSASIPAALPILLAVVALLLLLSPAFPRPTRALARGYLLCGTGVLTLALIDVLLLPFVSLLMGSLPLVIGAALGVIVVAGGGIARRLAAGASPQPPAATPALSTGRFACVLAGVVLIAISVAGLLAPRVVSLSLSYYAYWHHDYYASYSKALNWLVMLGTIPGIVLLVLGRGRARADETITGTALIALALTTPLFGVEFGMAIPPFIYLLLAVVGLLLFLIPVYPRPTHALARACLLCGGGILASTIIEWLYYVTGVLHIQRQDLIIATAIGVILVGAGLVARQLARRDAQADPARPLPSAATGR